MYIYGDRAHNGKNITWIKCIAKELKMWIYKSRQFILCTRILPSYSFFVETFSPKGLLSLHIRA